MEEKVNEYLKAETRNMSLKAKALRKEGFVTGCIFGREFGKIHSFENGKERSRTTPEIRRERWKSPASTGRQNL